MSKIVATEYLTLDGIMENPGGGWSFQFWNDEAATFKHDELFASDALLLGRITYEGFSAAWPTMTGTGEFGERMNSIPKYVVSTTLTEATWNNSTIIKDNIIDEIANLKQKHSQDILLCGSADLVNSLIACNLIDEYRLMVHPIIFGTGKHLFKEGNTPKTLKLVDTKTFSTGVTVLSYEPALSA